MEFAQAVRRWLWIVRKCRALPRPLDVHPFRGITGSSAPSQNSVFRVTPLTTHERIAA